jgi:N,N'-diacetylchitobiose transport system permease protein
MLAWATPAVSASVIFIWLADPDGGVVDWALARMPSWLGGGAHWAGFSWTNAPLPAYTLLTLLVVWQGFPFVAVSVLAGLKTIPVELHESARVDGGGAWWIFWRVTYPLLKPIFLVLLLLSIIWDFGVFTQPYLLIGQSKITPGNFLMSIYLFEEGYFKSDFGRGAAISILMLLMVAILSVAYVRKMVRIGDTP